ncbi:MAG: hypothetical protein JWM62_974 [Frankiales bacterium]|jgi:hypothetical protein|nr:hypothetical protein [Frankiales bacterium]
MRKRTLGVVLLAGLAMSGAGAFTASNTIASSTAGFGSGAVTGVTVTNTNYTLAALDNSKMTAMSFTHAVDLTGKTVLLELKNGTTPVVTTNACVPGAGGTAKTVCTFTVPVGGVPLTSFDGFDLTVHQ